MSSVLRDERTPASLSNRFFDKTKDVLLARSEQRTTNAAIWLGCVLIVISSAIHFHLWDIAYRHVATLGPLFLLQGASGIVIACFLALSRRLVAVIAALGLVAGTVAGFSLVLTVGLFNFKLSFISTEAAIALGVECAAIVDFAITSLMIYRRHSSASRSASKH